MSGSGKVSAQGWAVFTGSKQESLISSYMCFAVDEEDEYECVTVLNSHTQDVKHAVWHPTKEVRRSPPTGQRL